MAQAQEPSREERESAQEFIEELADRAGGSSILDGPWYMGLQALLNEGWRIIRPSP